MTSMTIPDAQTFSANMGDSVPETYPFTPTQLVKLRSKLEEEFARLLCSGDAERTDDTLSVNEAAETDSRYSIRRQTIVKAPSQTRLTAVTAALRRLDNGEFGECVRCGSRISFERLSVMPETSLCVACGGTDQKQDARYAYPEGGVVATTAIAARVSQRGTARRRVPAARNATTQRRRPGDIG